MPSHRLIASVLLFSLSTAHAQSLARQWRQTAALPPGTPLQLHLRDQPYPIPCDLAWIDLNALACETYDFNGTPHRTIYPATAIATIKRRHPRPMPAYHTDNNHRRALIVGMATGALIGGSGGSEAGIGTGFAGAAIGALIGAAFVGAATH